MKRFLSEYRPGLLLFAISIVIGLCVFRQYGMAWDEPTQRNIGLHSYNYVFQHNNALLTFVDRHYGVVWELPIFIIEKATGLTDSRDIYLMRHLATHVLFLFSALAFYVLVYRLFRSKPLAIVGMLMLLLTPRIYAHSFFNSKDIPLLSFFIISFTIAGIAFSKSNKWWFTAAGIACGITTATRVIGVMLPGMLGLFLLADLVIQLRRKQPAGQTIMNGFLFIAAFLLTTYATWPYLWAAPLPRFMEAYQKMARFPWSGSVLYRGNMVPGTALQASYLPTWFSITIPELWILTGVPGSVLLLINSLRHRSRHFTNSPGRNFILYLACFVVPIILVIVLHSVIYDDWRHLYFIYPSFILLVLYTIHLISRVSRFIWVVCAAQLIQVAYFMIRNHPYQQVYFNNFVSHDVEALRHHYELDYWGVSVINGLEGILKTDKRPVIKVANGIGWANNPLPNNILMLRKNDRNRFQYVMDVKVADYFVTNFRWHHQDYPYQNVLMEERVGNSAILRVYKLR